MKGAEIFILFRHAPRTFNFGRKDHTEQELMSVKITMSSLIAEMILSASLKLKVNLVASP